jgi:hypothetical protein
VTAEAQPHPRPLSHVQRVKLFGQFSYKWTPTPANKEAITVDPAWVRDNIVVLELPHIRHVNGDKPVRARFHRLAAPRFLSLFNAWRTAGLALHIASWDGSYVARYKRGKGGGSEMDLSNHAWGTAMDINARWNRLGMTPLPLGKKGSVFPLVGIAEELGFAWGGRFSNPDGMHFECVEV